MSTEPDPTNKYQLNQTVFWLSICSEITKLKIHPVQIQSVFYSDSGINYRGYVLNGYLKSGEDELFETEDALRKYIAKKLGINATHCEGY